MRIGAVMEARNIDVIVHDLCTGACAQYIFIAGRKRRLEDDSLVGFMNTIKSSSRLLAMATETLQVRNATSSVAERFVEQEEELYRKRGVSAALLMDPQVALQPRCVVLKRDGMAVAWNTASNYMMWVPSREYLKAAGVEFDGDWPKSDFWLGGLAFKYLKLRSTRFVRYGDDDPLRSKKAGAVLAGSGHEMHPRRGARLRAAALGSVEFSRCRRCMRQAGGILDQHRYGPHVPGLPVAQPVAAAALPAGLHR